MDWVFDHFRLIVIVGGAIAYWINQRKKAKEEEEAARTIVPKPTAPVIDEAERVRRIQEEIRRKIVERMGGVPKPALAVPPLKPVPQSVLPQERPRVDDYSDSQETEKQIAADRAMAERQEQLAARMRELNEQRREYDRAAGQFTEKTAPAMPAAMPSSRGGLLGDLRDTTSLRRAIVLREVLGTPVGMR